MKTRTKIVITLATALSGVALCGVALAAPAASAPAGKALSGYSIDASKLSAPNRALLRLGIDKARAADPATFHDVREIALHAREADRRARGRKAPNSLRLAGMGSAALLPMLELVAFDAPPLAPGETADDRASVARDLVEAIGMLRDPRASAVLTAVLERSVDAASTRTAAEALARLDTAEAASTLVASAAKASGDRATAIYAGMGSCHHTVIARALADRLATHPDDAAAHQIVKSLGHAGGAWAWKTLADRSEEGAARETAARGLVATYVQYTGEVREAAAKAILVVDDAHTSALIGAARHGASPDLSAALDALSQRVAHNPTR